MPNRFGPAFALALVVCLAAALRVEAQTPAYTQLRRDVLINADLWTSRPEILAANYGFEGIIGIPGLQTADDLQLAIDAGAGVNLDWAGLDPVPPFRNLTSGASPIGVLAAGYNASPIFGDAMPIEVSWPLLPSSVSPDKIAIRLNNGQVVTPVAAALNPNYDHNERHVIVVFGEFGNRLTPGTPGALYPVEVTFLDGDSPLMAVGPNGPVSLGGMSQASTNPYVAGPALVGAKLSHFSPVGDFAPGALANASPNDAYSLYGENAEYRLRLYTSGGFSPDGVSGFLPTDFSKFFRLQAVDANGNTVIIDEAGKTYDLGIGKVEVVGLAEVGAPVEGEADRAYYVEDHDNYFDVILKGDEAAIRLLRSVEIPTAAEEGYSDIYNPGGPGRTPDPGTIYTAPALPQIFTISMSLDFPSTVTYASQDFASYDLDDDLPVVFRLADPNGPDLLTSSSKDASDLINSGYTLKAVEFANETTRPGVLDVNAWFDPLSGDRIYTYDADEQAALLANGSWLDEGRAFGAFDRAWPGAAPFYRFFDTNTGWHLFTPDLNEGLQQDGINYEGVGWYNALFTSVPSEIHFNRTDDVVITDPIRSGRLLKEGTGSLHLAAGGSFYNGITLREGLLKVDDILAGGPLIVEQGGTLGGEGLIANPTTIHGTLAPGQSPGMLTFAAPVTMTAGSKLEIEIDGPSTTSGPGGYDRVLVLGSFYQFNAAGTLDVRLRNITPPATNSFNPEIGQAFPGIVIAGGGILGSFDTLDFPEDELPEGMRMDIIYNPQSIDLLVTPAEYANLEPVGVRQTSNQRGVGLALDAIRPAAGVLPTGAAADLFPGLAPLSAEQLPLALDSLSGQLHADILDSAAAGQRFVQSVFRMRLVELTAGNPDLPGFGESFWMQGLGSVGERRAANGIRGFDSHHQGFIAGADTIAADNLLMGLAGGMLESAVSRNDGSADVTSTFASLYSVSQFEVFRLGGHILGSIDDYDSQRQVLLADAGSVPRGTADGWGLAGGAMIDHTLWLGGPFTLEPMFGLTAGRVARDAFREKADESTALDVFKSHRSTFQSRLGATLGYAPDAWLRMNLSLGWNHEYLKEAASTSVRLVGTGYTVQSAPPGRDFLDFAAGVSLLRHRGFSLNANYLLLASEKTTHHGGMGNVQFLW